MSTRAVRLDDKSWDSMSKRIAGSAVSQCQIRHVITVRIATFTTSEAPQHANLADRWDAEIAIAFADANRIYNRYGIVIEQGHREDIPVEESRRVLTLSDEDQGWREFQQGAVGGQARWDAHLERGRLNDRRGSRYVVTEEVSAILAKNRGPRDEACSYWVPDMSPYGNTYHSGTYPGLRHEGVIIEAGAHSDTLAHELGHLTTRAGHDDFVGTPGEGNLPNTNLMWRDNSTRQEPRELNQIQLERIRASKYCRIYDRRRR